MAELPVEIWAIIASYHAPNLGPLMLTIRGLADYLNYYGMLAADSPFMRGFVRVVYKHWSFFTAVERIEGSPDRAWLRHGIRYEAGPRPDKKYDALCAYDRDRLVLSSGKLATRKGIFYPGRGFMPVGSRFLHKGEVALIKRGNEARRFARRVYWPYRYAKHGDVRLEYGNTWSLIIKIGDVTYFLSPSDMSFSRSMGPVCVLFLQNRCKLYTRDSTLILYIRTREVYTRKGVLRISDPEDGSYLSIRSNDIYVRTPGQRIHIRTGDETIINRAGMGTYMYYRYRGHTLVEGFLTGDYYHRRLQHATPRAYYSKGDGDIIRTLIFPGFKARLEVNISGDCVSVAESVNINKRVRGVVSTERGHPAFIDGRFIRYTRES